jgi:CHASE2 domain
VCSFIDLSISEAVMSGITQKIWQPFSRNPGRWVLYIFIALISVGVEMGGELFALLGISSSGDKPVALSMLYQRFVTAGYQKPRRRFVRIVVLSPSYEPQSIFGDVCKKREFEAVLLERLAVLSPSMVVLDFWYSPQPCRGGEDAKREAKLQAAILEFSKHFPVVLGRGSHTSHELQLDQDPDLPKLKESGFRPNDQVLDPKLDFPGDAISYGLVRINSDTRRIPINWDVFRDKAAVFAHSVRERLPSLAYEAASRRDPQLSASLSKIIAANEHPFTSFIPESDFHPAHAIDFVCGHMLKEGEDWTTCQSPDIANDRRFSDFKGGQVVLIAEAAQRDHFQSVIGEVPGYLLQANFIEGLLGNWYLRPSAPTLELILTVCGVISIIILFDLISDLVEKSWRPRRWPIAIGSLAGLATGYVVILLFAVVCNVIAMYSGWFVGFWLALVPIPLLELFFKLRNASIEAREKKALEKALP